MVATYAHHELTECWEAGNDDAGLLFEQTKHIGRNEMPWGFDQFQYSTQYVIPRLNPMRLAAKRVLLFR